MDILLALIAFALTMIVLSTLVSAIVEVLHELRGMRQRHLTYLVGAVFDQYLWPTLKGQAAPEPAVDAAAIREPEQPPPSGKTNWSFLLRFFVSLTQGRIRSGWWMLGAAFAVLCVLFGYVVLGILLAVILLAWLDQRWAPDWMDDAKAGAFDRADRAALRELRRLAALQAKADSADQKPLSATERAVLGELKAKHLNEAGEIADARLRARHLELEQRRAFIDAVAGVASAVATGPKVGGARFVKNINTLDFAAALARSDFGPKIKQVAGRNLEVMLNEIVRRFEGIGDQTSATFAQRSRKWSLVAAMILAFAANVDAVRLLQTYHAHPEIAGRIDAAYTDKVQALASQAQIDLAEAAANPSNAGAEGVGSREALKQTRDMLQKTAADIDKEADALAALGAPVGWAHFPYCVADRVGDLDSACLKMLGCKSELSETQEELAPRMAFSDYLTGQPPVQEELKTSCDPEGLAKRETIVVRPKADASAVWETLLLAGDHLRAAGLWIEIRSRYGLTSWLIGTILAGVLIGLGGPFWFQIYQRLSAVASIARSLGVRVSSPASGPSEGADSAVPNAAEAHKPKSVREAFDDALKAREIAATGGAAGGGAVGAAPGGGFGVRAELGPKGD